MKKAYGTLTKDLIRKYEQTQNPVTKSVYREILGNRIDRQELFRLKTIKLLKEIGVVYE